MNIKSLEKSDLIVIDAMLSLDTPVFAKDLAKKLPLHYDTVLRCMKDHLAMGMLRKPVGRGGRMEVNRQNPVMDLFDRIRAVEYKPPVEIDPANPPKDTVIVPREFEGSTDNQWGIME